MFSMQPSVYRFCTIALCALLIGSWQGQVRAAADSPEPVKLIEQFAKDLLENLEANRPAYRQDAAQLRKMVDQYMRPNFDVEFSAQRVLAQQWNDASTTQRSRFVEAFYQTVLQSYSQAIVDLSGEQLVQLPFRADDNLELAEVRYEVRKANAQPVPVSYLLRRDGSRWKIWDLKVEGLSYVNAYRFRMTGDVQKLGMDSAIEKLEAQVAPRAQP